MHTFNLYNQIITALMPNKKRKAVICIITVVVLTFILIGTGLAQGFARGYFTRDEALKASMVVVLSTTNNFDKPYVERATIENIENVIGITTQSDENLVTIASADQQVYVQSDGIVPALVSDINGKVKKGDKLTISPLNGILMRAEPNNLTIGRAQEDFLGGEAESQAITTKDGDKSTLISKMKVSVDNVATTQQPAKIDDKSVLERLGEAVAGKPVGELQVIIALVIFLIVMISEGSIIYGAISSGIISIGRNPMAKNIIRIELVRVLGVAVVVLGIGLSAVYFVLRV